MVFLKTQSIHHNQKQAQNGKKVDPKHPGYKPRIVRFKRTEIIDHQKRSDQRNQCDRKNNHPQQIEKMRKIRLS